jgi:hypothetical protein
MRSRCEIDPVHGVCVALLLCCACREIGAPLVDIKPERARVGGLICGRPPKCDRVLRELEVPSRAALPNQLSECGISPACQVPGQASDSAAMQQAEICLATRATRLPLSAHCTTLELQPGEEIVEITVQEAAWSELNLSVTSASALRISLPGAHLQTVFVNLNGPVTLRVSDAQSLDDLRVTASATSSGSPRLELENVQGEIATFGDADHPFEGAIAIRDTALMDVVLDAEQVSLESVVLENALVHAGVLTVTDVDMTDFELQATVALMSAFSAHHSRMHFCGQASLIDGKVLESEITTCPDTSVRLYNTLVASGAVDGSFDSDAAVFENVRMGASAPTRVLGFASSFSSVMFCGQFELLALTPNAIVKCSGCDEMFGSAERVCAMSEQPRSKEENFCPELQPDRVLPSCGEDVPGHVRPTSGTR